MTALLLAAVLAATHGAHALLPSLFGPLAAQVTDRLFALRARLPAFAPPDDGRVVHVFLDDRALKDLGTPYVTRDQYAQVIRNLGRARVAAQFHDAVFAAPRDPAEDEALLAATEQAGRVYFGMAAGPTGVASRAADETFLPPGGAEMLAANRWHPVLEGDAGRLPFASRLFVTFPELSRRAAGLGMLDVVPDPDGIYRRTPLLVREGDGFVPSLALRVACDVLGVRPETIRVRPGRDLVLPGARAPWDAAPRDVAIPIDRAGRTVVNYPGPWSALKNYSFAAVHDASDDRFVMQDLADELAGRVVVVSEVSTGAGDVGPVPVDPLYPRSGIHASVIQSILAGRFLRELTPAASFLWIELPLAVALFVLSDRLRTPTFLMLTVGLIGLYHLAAAGLFLGAGVIVNVPRPVILLGASALVLAAYHFHLESQARAVLRSTFRAYFPPSVVDKVMAQRGDLTVAAQRKELTILFSDIGGFTPLTAAMDAGAVRDLLNEYFEAMIEILFRHEGTLDKFIGDGLMAFFGDPEPQPDHAARAVRAALEMQQAVRRLDAVRRARGDAPFAIRIGIHTGDVIVGNIGSSRRVSYTVLGSPVNLAARLEANAPPGGILISARTRERLGDGVPVVPLGAIRVKGIDHDVDVFEVPVPRVDTPAEVA